MIISFYFIFFISQGCLLNKLHQYSVYFHTQSLSLTQSTVLENAPSRALIATWELWQCEFQHLRRNVENKVIVNNSSDAVIPLFPLKCQQASEPGRLNAHSPHSLLSTDKLAKTDALVKHHREAHQTRTQGKHVKVVFSIVFYIDYNRCIRVCPQCWYNQIVIKIVSCKNEIHLSVFLILGY